MQEEAGFVARRLSDRYSLRQKSEDAAAGEVARRLIAETRQETGEAILRLEAELRSAPDDPAGQARIDAARWQSSFAAVLEAGLAKWDAAEERLLVERVEWERAAGRDYVDGEHAWASAWEELSAGRSRWQDDIRAVLAAGEAGWRGEQADLAAAIRSASAELDRRVQGSAASRSEEIESLVDMFAQASQMSATARDTGRYWLDKIGVGLSLAAPYADIAVAACAPTDGTPTEAVLEQVSYWQDVLRTYTGHGEAAKGQLAELYAVTVDDDGDEGPLEEILSGTDPGSLLLDEYQVELLKAKAVADYWERELAVAQAVDGYARDLGSGRATEAESEKDLGEALAAYAEATAAYGRGVSALELAGTTLTGKQDAVAAALVDATRARGELEEARAAYDTQFALYSTGGGAFFAGQLRDRYRSLLELMGLGLAAGADAGGLSLGEAMAGWLTAARRHGFESSISLASDRIALLVAGALPPGQGVASLAALREAAASIRVPPPEDLPFSADELGVPLDSPSRPALEALLASCERSVGIDREFWSRQCVALLAALKAEAGLALAAREEAIRLLACTDGPSWFATATGRQLGSGEDVEGALAGQAAGAEGAYLEARARLELAGIARWQQWTRAGRPASLEDPADLLAFALCTADPGLMPAEAASRAAELEAFLDGGSSFPPIADGIGSFVVSVDGVLLDCAALGLASERNAYTRAAALLETWRGYAATAPGCAGERAAEGRAVLERALAEAGIAGLQDPASAARAVPTRDIPAAEEWLARLAGGLDEATQLLPTWQAERVAAWLDALARYAGSEAARAGLQPQPGSAREADTAGAVDAFRGSFERTRAAAAGGPGTYRDYLIHENLSIDEGGQPADSTLAQGPCACDQADIAHLECDDPAARTLANQALEGFNCLARAGSALASAFSADLVADAEESAVARSFSLGMAGFTREADPVSAWNPADEWCVSAEALADLERARADLDSVLRGMSREQQEIVRLGLALEQWRSSTESEPDTALLQAARESYAAGQAALDSAVAELEAASSAYDQSCRSVRDASSLLEQARLRRDIAQGIHGYAASAYLPAEGEFCGRRISRAKPGGTAFVCQGAAATGHGPRSPSCATSSPMPNPGARPWMRSTSSRGKPTGIPSSALSRFARRRATSWTRSTDSRRQSTRRKRTCGRSPGRSRPPIVFPGERPTPRWRPMAWRPSLTRRMRTTRTTGSRRPSSAASRTGRGFVSAMTRPPTRWSGTRTGRLSRRTRGRARSRNRGAPPSVSTRIFDGGSAAWTGSWMPAPIPTRCSRGGGSRRGT